VGEGEVKARLPLYAFQGISRDDRQGRKGVMSGRGELVLAVGNAGCSVRVYRRPNGDAYLFHEEVAVAGGVDENGDLVWENEAGDPVVSFEEVLAGVRGWLMLSPVRVHPDHAEAVWRTVRKEVEAATGPTGDLLRSRLGQWREVCGEEAG
jgi:hypothetical protein